MLVLSYLWNLILKFVNEWYIHRPYNKYNNTVKFVKHN